jgi:hypothetical protein
LNDLLLIVILIVSNRYVIFDRWRNEDARRNASFVGHGGGLTITLSSKERYFLVDEQQAKKWDRT